MKLLNLEAPLNGLSFGNVSYNIIRELKDLDIELSLFTTGDADFSAINLEYDLKKYIEDAVNKRWERISSKVPTLKLWHLNGSENRKTKNQHFFLEEVNVSRFDRVLENEVRKFNPNVYSTIIDFEINKARFPRL